VVDAFLKSGYGTIRLMRRQSALKIASPIGRKGRRIMGITLIKIFNERQVEAVGDGIVVGHFPTSASDR
jgi:hypothetical protein